ncbi:MAG: methionyl-tRNA formyltransferase [Reichenbachiella sp.]|uniref:methionyl-tRNA formyltransferase n=1 Tax=Reichenbachiella sp. TaxID=2184521 RepID=UPI0029660D0E|nr:methionyl-tRNA formyltransferase [Reichenbachiella sp.]MDW3211058.1 methionyl-tRNA formyltransferase [Reichenbachiella sp.]
MRIVFMGTPEFAVPSLQVLHENGYDIVGVITAPDRPKGRGKKLQGTPVKEYAESVGIQVLQPTNLKSEEFLSELRDLKADLQIVVAFRMLPEVVWNMPKGGTFNLHGSLLPQYRGAAPINWAIINGETETGVTTFFLKHEIDTGSVILQDKEPISPEDTVGDVYERLMHKGSKLVLKTVQTIEAGGVKLTPQVETDNLKSAPKIHKETCEINWEAESETIRNFVRGLSPYPAAWTTLGKKKFKVYKVQSNDRGGNKSVGEFETDNKTYVSVKTADGWLDLVDLQMEGKKRMPIEDLLRGFKFD